MVPQNIMTHMAYHTRGVKIDEERREEIINDRKVGLSEYKYLLLKLVGSFLVLFSLNKNKGEMYTLCLWQVEILSREEHFILFLFHFFKDICYKHLVI